MKSLDKGVCAPAGFRAGAAAGGIKKAGTQRLDCALIVSDMPASVAGVFTTNMVQAAPVRYCREICRAGKGRAIFANSGNANACTGDPGYADVLKTADIAGALLKLPPDEICVCSTGVIGVPMPMDRLEKGVCACVAALSDDGSPDTARAIMTTDTKPKELAVEVSCGGGRVRLGGIAKGAGMIAPNMATMLCFLTTDAAVAPADLRHLLHAAAEQSFNCICVDNDMSTNDTLLCLANGASGTVPIVPGGADYARFGEALNELCRELAQALVRDGEGATKFVEIEVTGVPDDRAARQIAASVARSQLCKTAFYGQDANWGRIACAAGYAGVVFDPGLLDVYIQGIRVLAHGCPVAYEEVEIQARMQAPELRVRLELNSGGGHATFWTSDLSVEYVTINADYRT
ncbi:MAG: Arginine biosynthesis bifunctional protein ArgJ [Candidatus Hydrogenedentes bacterium ADurb.Bin101]|nr:MAG: Arginine biosynthesis bifunctional protein ArgJ [Candidatus Hydrogenedentes bacterium ADurb.Bin101]HOC68678.1 bifunctional glutamate N-acetyltransferase/amino-acid acetyltransferase ArgJ [Candidatus Hydrogenedentota bacterium]